jgi:hypothetical protein
MHAIEDLSTLRTDRAHDAHTNQLLRTVVTQEEVTQYLAPFHYEVGVE